MLMPAMAQQGDGTEHLRLQIARAREKTHPEDAVRVYQKTLDELIDRKNNQAYKEAAERIRRIGRSMRA